MCTPELGIHHSTRSVAHFTGGGRMIHSQCVVSNVASPIVVRPILEICTSWVVSVPHSCTNCLERLRLFHLLNNMDSLKASLKLVREELDVHRWRKTHRKAVCSHHPTKLPHRRQNPGNWVQSRDVQKGSVILSGCSQQNYEGATIWAKVGIHSCFAVHRKVSGTSRNIFFCQFLACVPQGEMEESKAL